MGRFFDLDSPIMRALSRMADLMILNLLMIVLCLPIVTAGAAFTALHYVLLKMVRDEEGYLFRSFFKSFKLNFWQATGLWAIFLAISVLFVGDFIILKGNQDSFPASFGFLMLAISVMVLMIFMYVFPVLARFDNTIRATIKNAFLIMALNLPKTIVMAAAYLLPYVILYFIPTAFPLWLLFGISAPAFASALLYSKIFKKFEPEPETITGDMEFTIAADEDAADEVLVETAAEADSVEVDSEENTEE